MQQRTVAVSVQAKSKAIGTPTGSGPVLKTVPSVNAVTLGFGELFAASS